MRIFDMAGQAAMLRAEGNQQIASALADGARALIRRLGDKLAATRRR
jgi:hypothetical protein